MGNCSIEKSFLPSCTKQLDVKISLDTTKNLKGWRKPLQNELIIYKHCLACILLT